MVIETRLITYDYFMGELQQWEVELFYDNLKYANRPDWEQTRLLMYILALTNSKKNLKITDLLKFPWDGEGEDVDVETIEDTTENRNKLRARAKQFEKILLNLK